MAALDDAFGARLKSQFLGGYILSWLALRWDSVYVTLFVAADDMQYTNKLEYARAQQYPWWTWVLPAVVAFLLPLLLHSLDKWIQHLKSTSSDRWANRAAKKHPNRFVSYTIHRQKVEELSQVNKQLRDAVLDAGKARASAENMLTEVRKLRELVSEEYQNFLPELLGTLDEVRTTLLGLPTLSGYSKDSAMHTDVEVCIRKLGQLEKELRSVTPIGSRHAQTND